MAQQQDDVCLVCADPLEFTAFGSCGHKEVCSRCVARMRFVLQDKGCVFCRQENPQVFFTRFMGDYTVRMAPGDFLTLQSRADRRELFVMPEINAYFDDEQHFQEVRTLCGYTHPVLESAGGKAQPKFNNFNTLKRHIETTCNQYFCDVCVKARKVFVSEQLLYTKETLRRHQESGDDSGPMAESGFKGHPLCKFCRTRFFDANDLYRHMESSHEHCFLCRRAAPDKYVYYRHYKELEDHFTRDHHPCPHPLCLERKFVVFTTEYELKAHFAQEHGDEMKMSASQRRQALTIPLQLQYRSRDDEETEPMASAHLERAAVVIGGGHNISSRAARSGRHGHGSRGLHHSRSEPQIAQAAVGGQDGAAEVSSVTFTAEDFPAPESSQQAGAGPLGRWAAFTGAQAGAGGLSDQDFPSLPSLSKNQRRRIKEQQRTLADRLSSAAQPPRVINRASGGPQSASTSASAGAGSSGAGPTGAPNQALPAAADFPALSAVGPQSSTGGPAVASVSYTATATTVSSSSRAADILAPMSQQRRPPGFGRDEFPALGGGSTKQLAPPSSSPQTSAAYSGAASGLTSTSGHSGLSQTDVLNSLFMRPGSAAVTTGAGATATSSSAAASTMAEATPGLTPDEFPSLPGGSKRVGRARPALKAAQASPAKASGSSAAGASASAAQPAAGGGGGSGSVSESLKAANKALVDRVKRQLSGSAFDTFRQQSQLFMRGQLQAEEYHDYMVSLGLLSSVAELVSLCPDPTKRRLLLEVHRAFISSPAAQDPSLVGAGWMPPEAAVAKANRVAQHSAWGCGRCGVCNAPDDARCESCGASRPTEEDQVTAALLAAVTLQPSHSAAPVSSSLPSTAGPSSSTGVASGRGGWTLANGRGGEQLQQQLLPQQLPVAGDFPSLMPSAARRGAAASSSKLAGTAESSDNLTPVDGGGVDDFGAAVSSPGGSGKGKKSKGTTIKIGLQTGAGGGGGSRPHPQNQWTQPGFKAKVANQWSGPGGGKVAKMHGAINDGWE